MLIPQYHPPLVGEKFENLSTLLKNISKQSPVGTIAFSLDGKILASGTSDEILQLRKMIGSQWTLSKIFIAGSQGNWLSIDTIENRVVRGDDGTMLVTIDESGLIKPVPPPRPQQKGTLEVITPPGPLQTFDGQATPFYRTSR